MKKTLSVMLLGITLLLGGCWKKPGTQSMEQPQSNATKWNYEKTIPAPITQSSTLIADVTLGNVAQNKVAVAIPKGTFDADTTVTLLTPTEVPDYIGSEIEPIGSPIELSIGQPVRLNEPVTVTLAFDKTALSPDTTAGQLRIMYHDGTEWEYIKAKSIDYEQGIVTFDTFHFSLFGMNKVKDETKLTEQWIHSAALDKELRDKINGVSDEVANKIVDLTLAKMGISDESVKGKILSDVLKDDGYKEIYDAYIKGETTDAGQKLAVLVGTKMAEHVPASVFQEALGAVSGNAETVANVSKAAGYVAGGQYKDAAKVIGEQIADQFLITTAGKIAVEVVQGQIDSWKNAEVEAAYKAYQNGADGTFWGYNVEPKDFTAVWTQMRGIGRQLQLEAINRENAVRQEAGLPPLTDRQEALVREGVRASFQKQFETRSQNEAAIKQTEDNLRIMVDGFKKANFFDNALAPSGLDKGLDYENKLDVLRHFMEKVMKDTNRSELSTKNGLIMDKAIAVDDIIQAARYYFSGPDGKKQYAQFLKDRFGIDPFPKLAELSGTFKGTMTITDVILSEELKKQIAEGTAPKDEGCDFSMNFEELKGKSSPISLIIDPTSESAGTITFSGEGADNKAVPFTYSDGVMTASISDKGATGNLSLTLSQDASTYGANGSMIINYKQNMIKIIASVGASKPKAPK